MMRISPHGIYMQHMIQIHVEQNKDKGRERERATKRERERERLQKTKKKTHRIQFIIHTQIVHDTHIGGIKR